MTQFVFQLVTPGGRFWSWQEPHETAFALPVRSCPWHCWHLPRPSSATGAWNPALVVSIHAGSCPTSATVPERCWPVVWQPTQSLAVAVGGREGCVGGMPVGAWQSVQTSGPGAFQAMVFATWPSG